MYSAVLESALSKKAKVQCLCWWLFIQMKVVEPFSTISPFFANKVLLFFWLLASALQAGC